MADGGSPTDSPSCTGPRSWPSPSRVTELNRILVIRGGAIGDFVLTLPAIKLLRDRFPEAHLEILGLKQIVVLAERRFYADAIRSLDDPRLARFFAAKSDVPAEFAAYFAKYDLILSYLSDPDRIFETNVKRCSSATFLGGPAKLDRREHAAFQLARPLEGLGLFLKEPAAAIYPSEADRMAVRRFREDHSSSLIVFHPGSGSETKNWPIENWIKLGDALLAKGRGLLIVAGEADTERTAKLESAWSGQPVRFAENLPLPHLAALLEGTTFIGHDSGISHIAAAVGARCVLLFGATDPAIWAPAHQNVTVLQAPHGKMALLDVDLVLSRI
jgi:ADP-heptose:LPS heptosyltransferase